MIQWLMYNFRGDISDPEERSDEGSPDERSALYEEDASLRSVQQSLYIAFCRWLLVLFGLFLPELPCK